MIQSIRHYQLVASKTIIGLEKDVNYLCTRGYIPNGNVVSLPDGFLIQPMILPEIISTTPIPLTRNETMYDDPHTDRIVPKSTTRYDPNVD